MKKNDHREKKAYEELSIANKFLFKTPKINSNLYKAISSFNASSTFLSKVKHPDGWAIIQEGLGFAYYSLKPRNNIHNIYLAIDFFLNIFTVRKEYQQKELRQVYGYLAYLARRLVRLKSSDHAKTRKYSIYIKKLNKFFDRIRNKKNKT